MIQQRTAAAVATGMELSILKLGSPRRRFASAQFSFDFETGYLNSSVPATPSATAPASPLGRVRSTDEYYEMEFEQHQAAIPFIWEEKPGTPRDDRARTASIKEEEESSGSEDEGSDSTLRSDRSSRSSSTRESNESPPRGPPSEFEFLSSETADKEPDHSKPADDLFVKEQIRPLKLPPRLQSIKQLIAADAAEDALGFHYSPSRTPGYSFRRDGLRTPTRSFRKDGLKAFISSPRREKQGEQQVTTMLGFEEWPKDENRKDGPGHRRAHSLSKLPALFRKKYGLGKENMDHEFGNENLFNGDASGRKSLLAGGENRRPLDCLSSRTMGGSSYGKDDFFEFSHNILDVDARSDYFNTSGRTIPEEEPQHRDEQQQQVQAPDLPQRKRGKLSRFFTKKPSRLSAVAPSPSPEDLQIKRVQHTSPLLKMCLSNCIGQALIRGVKHFRFLDSQPPRRALSAAR